MSIQTGTTENDTLIGSQADDLLVGLTGSDIILGGDGDDIIEIRDDGSSDTLDGGSGVADSLWYRGPIILPIIPGSNIRGFENITLDPEGEAITQYLILHNDFLDSVAGRLNINVISYEFNNIQISADSLWAGGVTIYSSKGDDQLTGSSGDDIIMANGGRDLLRGGTGNDELHGGAGADYIMGDDGDDVIYGDDDADNLIGGNGDDYINGGAGWDVISGGSGFDTLDGGEILDIINFSDGNLLDYSGLDGDGIDRIGVLVNLSTGKAIDGYGHEDHISNFFSVRGSALDDIIIGSSNNRPELFYGSKGNDLINGGHLGSRDGKGNAIDYGSIYYFGGQSYPVYVFLDAGLAFKGDGFIDELININQVRGTPLNDYIAGSDTTEYWEWFVGRAGDDTIDGQLGIDLIRHDWDPAGVYVNIGDGLAQDGYGYIDNFYNIEGVIGSKYSDTLLGSGGDDFFEGRTGDDFIDGGDGIDSVMYSSAESQIIVNLIGEFASGSDGFDTLLNIENVFGGIFDDQIIGNDNNNYIDGNDGDDAIRGYGGNDTLTGGAGNDTIDGGPGFDLVYFTGRFDDYDIYFDEDGSLIVTDTLGSRDGTDFLHGAEILSFDDQSIKYDDLREQLDPAGLSQGVVNGISLSGLVYHWKSHALLNDVHIAMGRLQDILEDPLEFIDLRDLRVDTASGLLTVDVWARPTEEASTFQFSVHSTQARSMSFKSALGTTWADYSGMHDETFTWAAIPKSLSASIDGPIRLGELSVSFENYIAASRVEFFNIVIGNLSIEQGPDLIFGPTGASNVSGAYIIENLPSDSMAIHASRHLENNLSKSGINVHDAYAALKIAFGVNPNPDPDGTGPTVPLQTSPYQFMAADVNGSGTVTLSDALGILRIAVGAPNAPTAEWMFVPEAQSFWNHDLEDFSLNKDNVVWNRAIELKLSDDDQANLVGVLKGDVDGSWNDEQGRQKITDLNPNHFFDLELQAGIPLTQWGIYPS